MIQISNWIANIFILGLGVLFFSAGAILLVGLIAGIREGLETRFFRTIFHK